MRLPRHPWRPSRARTERLQEQELERLASRIPDQETLDHILADYPEMQHARVLGRIRKFLKFETEQAV